MDLARFNGQVTIGCNHIFRHPSFPAFHLKYYVAGVPFRPWRQLSPRFTHQDHARFFLDVDNAFRVRDTVHFYHATIHRYLESRNLLCDIPRYYFLQKDQFSAAKKQAIDLVAPITFADGALTLMIALAIFMGCTEIYLFGCGYTYSPAQLFHFFDCMRCPPGIPEAEMDAAVAAFSRTHPESDFALLDKHGSRVHDNQLLVDFSFDSIKHRPKTDFYHAHRLIRSFAESNGVRILNVVPAGYISPVYEYAPREIGSSRVR